MVTPDPRLGSVDAVARDRTRGAAALAAALAPALVRLRAEAPALLDAALQELRAGQPAMVGLHALAEAAREDCERPGALATAVAALARAPAALARLGSQALRHASHRRPLRVVTWSGSGSVGDALIAAAATEPVHVTLGEGRPALEGTALGRRLREAGLAVTILEDGAVTTALPDASLVVVGADAVGPDAFINKAGTLGLAAAARCLGLPVLVLATRQKYVATLPPIPAGDRLFERIPLELATELVSDTAILTPEQFRS
ncbi:MAG: hypothetical protein AB7O67_09215 [Vicinamibacterales bacterium]